MKDCMCCCVCLKDEPFENNPIVSCDGKNCTTVVHKVCYGIQQIPDGAWFCQKCISQERTARVRCELCPSREGALKHTNKGGWCHIICALFVPGAEFLDADRLEIVSLDKVSTDKLNKVCTICEKNNRLDRASIGACIQCIKSGCKVMFHVTCGQSQGLLTEVVSVKEGVRYVAYCSIHKQKSKRRDFTIRLSNSINCASRLDKNKLRQSPPQLEKSDEDCVTPQESSSSNIGRSSSGRNPNISSSSSNINISSDSMSQDDSSAPEICLQSENKEFKTKSKEPVIPAKCQVTKSLETPQPPNISNELPVTSTDNLLPPNICCSNTSDSVAKEEATVKFNVFPSSSTTSTKSGESELSGIRTSKRQAALSTPNIPNKKEKLLKTEQKLKSVAGSIETPIKIKKMKKLPTAIKTKIENRVDKKSVPPSLPKSIVSHMSSIIGGSTSLASTPSTSSTVPATPKLGGSSCQSMEELLEWQWDQAGALLMQQAEASDIASLLSCLHDLKNENEQLLVKQLKLSHRRDHLKAINAKLQLQLMSKPGENVTKTVANVPNIPMSEFRPSIQQPPLRNIQKALPVEQVQYKQLSLHAGQTNIDVNRPRTMPSSEGGAIYIQQQPQQQQQQQQLQQQHQQQQPMSIWNQASSQQNQQSLNHQTLTLLKQYQQKQQSQQQHQQQQQQGMTAMPLSQSMASGVSVSNLFSQTDLVALLNIQLHNQLSGCVQQTPMMANSNQTKSVSQDIHISPNNGTNMEYLYQALQQKTQLKYQPQAALSSNIYYQAAPKMPIQSGMGINFDSINSQQNPDNSTK